MSALAAIALTSTQLRDWPASPLTDVEAYVAGPGLGATFDLDDASQWERACVLVASVAALAAGGRRLVAVVERGEAGSDWGRATLPRVEWGEVVSLFADSDDADPTDAATAAQGLTLSDAWDQPAVAELLAAHELLWFDPSERSDLCERG